MDATAYLTRQGWRGNGHSLHPTGRGIKKPLLVSQKFSTLGIGKKNHDAHADQWWARAFDRSLKGLDVSKNETPGATDSVNPEGSGTLDMIRAGGEKRAGRGGLYAGFVRGEGLSGTMTLKGPAAAEVEGKIGERQTEVRAFKVQRKKRRRTAEEQEAKHQRKPRRIEEREAITSSPTELDRNVDAESHANPLPPEPCKFERRRPRRTQGSMGAIEGSVRPVAMSAEVMQEAHLWETELQKDQEISMAEGGESSTIEAKTVRFLPKSPKAPMILPSKRHKSGKISLEEVEKKRQKDSKNGGRISTEVKRAVGSGRDILSLNMVGS